MRFLFPLLIIMSALSLASGTYFTVQVASFQNKKLAEKFFRSVSGEKDAHIDFVDGRYKVRIGYFKTYEEAKKFLEKSYLKRKFRGAFITRTFCKKQVNTIKGNLKLTDSSNSMLTKNEIQPENNTALENKTETLTLENETANTPSGKIEEDSNGTPKKEKPIDLNIGKAPKVIRLDSKNGQEVTKVKKIKGKQILLLLMAFPTAFFPLLYLLLKFSFRKREGLVEKDFHSYISELYSSGRFSDVVSTAFIYLSKVPDDTFVKEIYADSLKELGRNLEAADVYFDLSKEFMEKGSVELSEKFKLKGEELIDREFGG